MSTDNGGGKAITDELREWAEDNTLQDMVLTTYPPQHAVHGVLETLLRIADRIDAEYEKVLGCKVARAISDGEDGTEFVSMPAKELSERYVELPKDAHDEYVHIGDVMEWVRYGDDDPTIVRTVIGVGYEVFFAWSDEQGRYAQYEAHAYRHHKPPTVEDVLREFAEKITDSQIPGVHPTYEEAIAEYAKRLTLAEGEEA